MMAMVPTVPDFTHSRNGCVEIGNARLSSQSGCGSPVPGSHGSTTAAAGERVGTVAGLGLAIPSLSPLYKPPARRRYSRVSILGLDELRFFKFTVEVNQPSSQR